MIKTKPSYCLFIFRDGVSLCHSGWSAVVPSRLTATCTSQVQAFLLTSGDPLASACQSAGITGMNYHAWPDFYLFTYLFLFFWDGVLLLLPRLECSGTISAYHNLCLLSSSNSPASASQAARTIVACHQTRLIFFFFFGRVRVSPRWPGWSRSPDLMRRPPWPPPKGAGITAPGCDSLFTIYLLQPHEGHIKQV